jgi:hypothetical protein
MRGPGPDTGISRLRHGAGRRFFAPSAAHGGTPFARGGETALSPKLTSGPSREAPLGENGHRFHRKESGPAAGAASFFRGGDVHLAPAASGPVGMCRLIEILPRPPFLTRPLSGGSARRFTVPGEAAARARGHASTAEGAEVAAAQLPRAHAERPPAGRLLRSAFSRPALPGGPTPYSGDSSSVPEEARGSSGGTVTFSGVTSPGMNVMSTSSPGSPSSPCFRPTRIVEPGSIARPST